MTTNRQTPPEATKKTAKSAAGKTKAAATPENATSATQKATAQPPAAKKPAKRSAKPKTAASQAAPAPAAEQAPPIPQLTPEQRRMYVEVAAYYIAERRGFQGGSELEDWVQAEAEIDRLLREGILKP
jgi:hypothetical protein